MSAIYRKAIAIADKFVPPKLQPLWNHEAGKPFLFRLPAHSYLIKDVSLFVQWRAANAHFTYDDVSCYVILRMIQETAGSLRIFTAGWLSCMCERNGLMVECVALVSRRHAESVQ